MHIDMPSLVIGLLIGLFYAFMMRTWRSKP